MSGLINKPILIAHPNAPAVGRTLEYIFDDGAGTVEPYYMKSDGIPLPLAAGGGVTDHTLLTNIGVKTHATLDTEVGTNTTNNTGTVTIHSDITSAGSGDIITDVERTKLTGIEPLAQVTKVPVGGLAGQVLEKVDGTDYNSQWATPASGVTDHLLLSNIGVKTHATLDTEVGLNNAKVTNVTTDLATTHNASTVVVTSSDGTDATINAATATTAGIMSEAIYDNHVLNNAKVSDINHVTIELPNVDNTSDADKPVSTAQAIANTTDRNRANHTGTQVASTISDFDTEVSNNTSVTVNSSKVTNATHTGEVTGSGVLTVDKTSITNKTTVTAVSGDFLLISDTGDTGNLKKVDALDFLGTAPVDSVNGQTGVVVLDADDISDAATTNKFATAAELAAITTNTTNNTGTVTVHNDVTSAGSGDIITGVERTKLTGIEPLAQVTKIPTGGLGGQILEKVDGTDYNTQWATSAAGVTDHLLLSNIGVKSHITLDAEVSANNAKVTNVTTDLAYTTAASTGTVTSSDGTDATLPAATTSLAGLQTGADKTKLDGIDPLAQVTKIPTGGLGGQVLEKVDGTDYNIQWATSAAGVTDHLLLSNIGVKTHATLDTEVGLNNVKVTNATHTGEVTGSGVLTVDKTSITNKTTVTPVIGDFVLISDTGDTGNLKKVDVADLPVAHSALTSITANDHHDELHSIASHNDTTATGANLDTLTGGGNANSLHVHLDSLPAAIAGVITLADNKAYTLIGATNIGTDRIVFGVDSSIRGYDPQKDIITYTGTGNMFTSVVNGFSLDHIGVSCANGTMIQATNIDYAINPSVDPMQGRNARFSVTRCNLVGGGNGLGSRLGFLEGYATCNFNGNVITNWDIGFELSNCLSFEGLNNKSVLWNDQASTMITLRSNNWSGQTGGVGSYIPTGINAFNFNGNILHPRTSGYAASIDSESTTALGNIAGNIFITTGITTGGIFNPSSVGFNELPTYNIQANTGIPDNTPTIQASIDRLQSYVTTINTINVLEKLNFGNSIKTTANLLVSSRLLVTNATGFLVDEIVTGGTSGFTGKVQSIDTGNNYIWIKYVVDGSGNAQSFTVGETLTGGTSATATTYNGVDGTFKYYGAKEISVRFIATITLEKVGNGRDTFEIVPVKNGVALDDLSTVTYLEGARPRDGIAQAIIPFATDDILELHIRNLDDVANCECQGLVFNISGR